MVACGWWLVLPKLRAGRCGDGCGRYGGVRTGQVLPAPRGLALPSRRYGVPGRLSGVRDDAQGWGQEFQGIRPGHLPRFRRFIHSKSQ